MPGSSSFQYVPAKFVRNYYDRTFSRKYALHNKKTRVNLPITLCRTQKMYYFEPFSHKLATRLLLIVPDTTLRTEKKA